MKTLHILYDAECAFCRRSRDWLATQGALVQFVPLAQQSPEVATRFPEIRPYLHPRELTVVSDAGAVWHGPAAVVVCLHAIEEHRQLAARMAEPWLLPYAPKAFEFLMANPEQLTPWLLYTPQVTVEQALRHYTQNEGQLKSGARARPPALPLA